MSTSSPPSPRSRRIARFLPAMRGWWLVGGAVVAGLVLFALVLSGKRDEFEFYRAEGGALPDAPGQVFDPLPAPLPAGESAASGMDTRQPPATETPAQARREEAPADAAAPSTQAPATPAQAAGTREPQVLSAPPPEYPTAALRAGATGEVVLRIDVDAQGRPTDVTVVSSSRNRELDRAALRAVRRWRFEPAMRDGVAVAGTVQQSIQFDVPH